MILGIHNSFEDHDIIVFIFTFTQLSTGLVVNEETDSETGREENSLRCNLILIACD